MYTKIMGSELRCFRCSCGMWPVRKRFPKYGLILLQNMNGYANNVSSTRAHSYSPTKYGLILLQNMNGYATKYEWVAYKI